MFAGTEVSDDIPFAVWNTGYKYFGGAWEPVQLSGTPIGNGGWIIGKAAGIIPWNIITRGAHNLVAAYMCQWSSGQWKCGCADVQCLKRGWILQSFFAPNNQAEASLIPFRVMTLNVKENASCESCYASVVATIRDSQADVAGLQEANAETIQNIALNLGWHASLAAGIVSKYPIIAERTDSGGAKISFANSKDVWVFNVHLPAFPYGPYEYRDTGSTALALAAEQQSGRTSAIQSILTAMTDVINQSSVTPVLLLGDFNAPSHRDWTGTMSDEPGYGTFTRTAILWPVSSTVEKRGFQDAYRRIYPSVSTMRGNTWTPAITDEVEVHDRIDFIYYHGYMNVSNVWRVGAGRNSSDKDILPSSSWPLDHRAVLVEFSM